MHKPASPAQLAKVANQVRVTTLKMLNTAGSGHTGGPLGIADVLVCLYFAEMNIDPHRPNDPGRDRFVLSAAHMVPVLYSTLAHKGIMPMSEVLTLRKTGSRLKGHTFRNPEIGLETTGGSLGQGLSVAIGFALADRLNAQLNNKAAPFRTYCVIGDGEINEGSIWEGALLAPKYQLDNLCVILDRNGIQLSGDSQEILPLEPLAAKWRDFGWNVIEIDGNDIAQILFALGKARLVLSKPTIILAQTVPGKGVSFMQNKWEWHGKVPNENELRLALAELEDQQNDKE